MSFFKKQGFTLIELMVVIVIIGVLASLAIPRFTEASAKAKMSEAPLVLKSFENGVLAAAVEQSPAYIKASLKFSDVVVDAPKDSKWWYYDETSGGNAPGNYVATSSFKAVAAGKMGKFLAASDIGTKYIPADDNNEAIGDCFFHTAKGDAVAKQMVPQFMGGGCEEDGKKKK